MGICRAKAGKVVARHYRYDCQWPPHPAWIARFFDCLPLSRPYKESREFQLLPSSRELETLSPPPTLCPANGLWILVVVRKTIKNPFLASRGLFIFPVIGMKIPNFHTHRWPRRGHGNSRPGGNPEPWPCADTVRATNIRRVDGGIAACVFPSAQPSLHTTRALGSRCDENDGVGPPDSHRDSTNGYQ